MPKKRFTSQYSKPQSTVHPSLNSPATAGNVLPKNGDAGPSVNDLIASLRKSSTSLSSNAGSLPTPTLPPQIRHLLAQPETPTPTPRIRSRRALDANGRRIPPGPPPPRSWLESHHAPGGLRLRDQQRVYPTDIYQLPGLKLSSGRRLQDMCLRQMARHWEFIQNYEQNNLADLPTGVRIELLSHIAVNGPDDGIGIDGLRNLVIPKYLAEHDGVVHEGSQDLSASTMEVVSHPSIPEHPDPVPEDRLVDWEVEQNLTEFDYTERNDKFFRVDLSGSLGHSISVKQLTTLIERPSLTLSAPLPHLTHLSLSYPGPTVSWRGLLLLCNNMSTLTHLSLAYWPTPSMTRNSRTTVMSSPHGRDVQYGGTNFYSHSLDDDYQEAADVLRRLAGRLYGLEYLDVSGCMKWIRALQWPGVDGIRSIVQDLGTESHDRSQPEGIDWARQWPKLSTLRVNGMISLGESSDLMDINSFVQGVRTARTIERTLAWWSTKGKRKGTWVDVEYDNYKDYGSLWKGTGAEEKLKRATLDKLKP